MPHKKAKKKKEVKVKSKAQWPTWKAPFQKGSNLYFFSQLMIRKGGIKHEELERVNKKKKRDAKITWLLKCFRKGSAGGWTWEFNDSNGRYRITNVKLHKKEV